MSEERRYFSRIPFAANAHVIAPHGDVYLNCTVIDISLNGLPVRTIGQQSWLMSLMLIYCSKMLKL